MCSQLYSANVMQIRVCVLHVSPTRRSVLSSEPCSSTLDSCVGEVAARARGTTEMRSVLIRSAVGSFSPSVTCLLFHLQPNTSCHVLPTACTYDYSHPEEGDYTVLRNIGEILRTRLLRWPRYGEAK
jgi:hypothetical protein